jgi:hypothetical protein
MKFEFINISEKPLSIGVAYSSKTDADDTFISYSLRGVEQDKAKVNMLAYDLIDLLNNSSKHNAIVTSKVNYITGGGLITEDEKEDAKTKEFLLNPNDFEDANQVLEKCATDYELQGGYYLQLVFGKLGEQLVSVYHVPFEKMQPNENASKFKFVDDPKKPREYVIYDAYDGIDKTGTKILYVSTYRPGSGVLTLPEYYASLRYIQIDKEIANFNYNNIKSGFSAGTMIVLYDGEPQPEEEQAIKDQLKANTTGSEEAGNTWIYFAKPGDDKPEVIPLNGNDLVDKFTQLNEQCRDEIFIGHKIVSPMLFGVRVEGTLGGRNEILEAYELLNSGYIEPKQKTLQATFNMCNRLYGGQSMLIIKPSKPMGLDYVDMFKEGIITDRRIVQKELGLEISEDVVNVPSQQLSEQGKPRNIDWVQFEQFGEPAENFEEVHVLDLPIDLQDNGETN